MPDFITHPSGTTATIEQFAYALLRRRAAEITKAVPEFVIHPALIEKQQDVRSEQ